MIIAIDIMPLLKRETQEQHRQIETLLYTDKLMAATLSLAEYTHLLTIQAVFHRSLEEAVTRQSAFLPDFNWRDRQKTGWLAADLQALNQPVPAVDTMLFTGWTGYQLLGALYVAEGSMLGGRFIAKAMARTPALLHAPTRFYAGYGELTGLFWKAFGTYLTHHAPGHEEEILDGATQAFRSFQLIIERVKVDE